MQTVDEFLQTQQPQESPQMQTVDEFLSNQESIIPKNTPITQDYGNYNPGVEVFSGGTNTGADFGTAEGTPINAPKDAWIVVDAFNGAKNGYIGDNENQGYGNSIVLKNIGTGEKMRFSHLSEVNVKPGDIVSGDNIGKTGKTGNVTGPHLDAEYYNSQGQLGDILQSPYKSYLPN